MHLSKFFIILFCLFTYSSCDKKEEPKNSKYDCTFVQNDADLDGIIDATERSIMDNCYADKLTNLSDIKNNLIGEWELIGHGEGWIPTVSQPCGYIWIENDMLTLEFSNEYIDTTTVHSWDLKETNNGIHLEVSNSFLGTLSLNVFCEDYMYGDATPYDGNMHLYQKVN